MSLAEFFTLDLSSAPQTFFGVEELIELGNPQVSLRLVAAQRAGTPADATARALRPRRRDRRGDDGASGRGGRHGDPRDVSSSPSAVRRACSVRARPIISPASSRTASATWGASRVRSSVPALLRVSERDREPSMNAKPDPISWHERARALEFRTQAFIDGRYLDAASGATFDSINPATGKLLARVASGDEEDIDRAVTSARAAFRKGAWVGMRPAKRKKILLQFAELIMKHPEELALLETLDMGKPIRDCRSSVDIPARRRLHRAGTPRRSTRCTTRSRRPAPSALALDHARAARRRRRDRAVELPAADGGLEDRAGARGRQFAWCSSPPRSRRSRRSGWPSWRSRRACRDGVLQRRARASARRPGKALALHMDVDCIAFTGSTEVGRMSCSTPAQSNLKRVSLECGGKSPNIVMADYPRPRHGGHGGGASPSSSTRARSASRRLAAARAGGHQGRSAREGAGDGAHHAARAIRSIPRRRWARSSTRRR